MAKEAGRLRQWRGLVGSSPNCRVLMAGPCGTKELVGTLPGYCREWPVGTSITRND